MRTARKLIMLVVLACTSPLVMASDYGFDLGIEYKKVPEPQTIAPYKNKVQEIFYYGCPHCYNLEASLNAWKKTKSPSVIYEQVPAVLENPNWVFMARVFYTAKNLGILEQFHGAYFDAIQRDKKRLYTPEALAKFCEPMGIKAEDYIAMFNSFKVNQDIQRARRLTQAYGIKGVPSVVINGQFITDVGMAGGREEVWRLVNQLTAQ